MVEVFLRVQVPVLNQSITARDAYPLKKQRLVNISTLSSKDIRAGNLDIEDSIICVYKIGLILAPGEVIAWTNRLKKLSSTRHRNIALRIAHGDIFSNSRLFRFGLNNSATCLNCPEPSETIQHRLLECPKAKEAWNKLDVVKTKLQLTPLVDHTLENILGAGIRRSKLELALQLELMLRLSTKSDGNA